MTYEIIQPPYPMQFTELAKAELKEYYSWFIGEIPTRVEILKGAVRNTGGFENWNADYEPASLIGLGNWFSSQVRIRPRTQEEVEGIESRLRFPLEIPNYELDTKTTSLSIDLGMYFGSVLIRNHCGLRWDQKITSKKFADYGQPVVVGFGAAILNPVRIVMMLAYGVADGSQSGNRLEQLYKVWSNMVKA